MALNTKNPEAERLARELAAATGGNITRAVTERVARLPLLDDRSPDEIVGYDDDGLPA
ncbi:MAG TPA: type II toxin-antitoxin system VapB family antitoxin [Longimicrobiaceae bacterium]|nr:type II toxin-antitoxin system VapB family antitoxin [Longimicrobiaceae bacterium]